MFAAHRKSADTGWVPDTDATVYVIEPNTSLRRSLSGLIELAGWRVEAFDGAEGFECPRTSGAGCLVMDACAFAPDAELPLAIERIQLPVICIGRGDPALAVCAIKAGAVEFLVKPVSAWELLHAIDSAVSASRNALEVRAHLEALRARSALLSQRERQVMTLVCVGLLNKQVAGELGISEITVKAHRGRVMRKMGARSFVDLVNMANLLGLTRTRHFAGLHPRRGHDVSSETIIQWRRPDLDGRVSS